MGDRIGTYRVSMERPEGKRPFARPKLKWKENTKMYLQEMGGAAWSGLFWLRIGTGGWFV